MEIMTEAIAEALRELGLDVEPAVPPAAGVDLVARIPIATPVQVGVDVRRRSQPLGPVEAAHWAKNHADKVILALPSIPKGRGAQYRALGINYVDSGGNAYLRFPGFHVHVEGRRPRVLADAAPRAQSASANPAGLKVAFALLVAPGAIEFSYDKLATLAAVSKGTVANTMADLRRRGHIFEDGPRRTLVEQERLARDWVDGYVRDLGPRLRQLELAGPGPEWWARNWSHPDGIIGGGVALAELGAGLRPDRTVVYGQPPWQTIRREARLSREGAAPVVLREQFWSADLLGGARLVPPLLVYADALAGGEPREVEAAQELAERNQWTFAR